MGAVDGDANASAEIGGGIGVRLTNSVSRPIHGVEGIGRERIGGLLALKRKGEGASGKKGRNGGGFLHRQSEPTSQIERVPRTVTRLRVTGEAEAPALQPKQDGNRGRAILSRWR